MILSAAVLEASKNDRFARSQGFPYWTLSLMRTGSAKFDILDADPITVSGPALLLIRPGTAYTRTIQTKVKEVYAIFRPIDRWIELIDWEAPNGVGVLQLDSYGTVLTDVLTEVQHYWKKRDENGAAVAGNALERALLLAQRIRLDRTLDMDERIKEAVRYIENHLDSRVSVDELASEVEMSRSYFGHRFRRETGLSPLRYQQHARMLRARQLLLYSNMQVRNIAKALGFVNPYHFSTRFRKHTGQSPSQFRKHPNV